MIGNVSPGVGVKPLIEEWSVLPVSVAVPLTTSWVTPLPGFSPLTLKSKFEFIERHVPRAVRIP